MSEDYIEYWGLRRHPFLLAPDSEMMHTSGQYYECLERLKYAINTNKGGALLVSEDAGLGKTTLLLKLIDEMKAQHGNAFKYAFVNHPTLTPNQLIALIAGCFADATPDGEGRQHGIALDFGENRRQVTPELSNNDDKLKNLMRLRESLLEVKRQGGKNIIIVDEGQMLCGARDVLQELRVLINLTYNNEYLHTFILSGQKPLWNEVKSIPELWQRLPVRYYLVSLRLEETRELIKYRLAKAGLGADREIFTSDAIEIIQKYSMGSPRTIIALADLALLMGYADRSARISFKELTKAINAMAGKGESLAYVKEEKPAREPLRDDLVRPGRGREITQVQSSSPPPPPPPLELRADPVSIKEEEPVEEPLVANVVPDVEQETVQEEAGSPPTPPVELSANLGSVRVEVEKPTVAPLIDMSAAPTELGQEPVQTEGGQDVQEWARSKLRELEADSIGQGLFDAAPPNTDENKRPGLMERPIRPRLAVLTISLAVTVFVGLGYYIASDDVKTLKTAPVKEEVFLSAGNTNAQKIGEEQPLKIEPIPQEEAARQRDGEKSQKTEPPKSERETLTGKTAPMGPQGALQNRNVVKPEKEASAGKTEPMKQEEAVRQRVAVKPEKEVQTKKAGLINQEKVERNGNMEKGEKEVVVVSTTGANIRSGPDIRSQRIGLFMEGEQFKVVDEKKDADGQIWYKFYMHGSREGWVSEKAVGLK
jgi:type II secretory pathway predicted ATPase ExeA